MVHTSKATSQFGPSPEISDEMQKLIADGKKKFDDDISQLAQDVKERLSKDKSLDVKDSPKEVSDDENQSNVPVGANDYDFG
ncbi:hypothetical protein MAR_017533 [Mya arenaria]|uniref:Uncharacterized protein n=1 Tax=Mya arenaria TaxID=6604 RepID=A0ABY7ECJ4_MYAAR|nr:hypothetical protein MAR_017533 [Mya arenaria]